MTYYPDRSSDDDREARTLRADEDGGYVYGVSRDYPPDVDDDDDAERADWIAAVMPPPGVY